MDSASSALAVSHGRCQRRRNEPVSVVALQRNAQLEGGWSTAVSLAMFAAECYGFLVVLHHYVVAMRNDPRAPAQPPGPEFCPASISIVTSYNEDVDICRRTLVGCQAIEYRNKRIYLLTMAAAYAHWRSCAAPLGRRLHHERQQRWREGREHQQRFSPDLRRLRRHVRRRSRAGEQLPERNARVLP
jgi:hypothetical protein